MSTSTMPRVSHVRHTDVVRENVTSRSADRRLRVSDSDGGSDWGRRIPVLGMGSVCTSVAAYVAVDAISTHRTRRTTAIGRRRPPLLQDATPVVLVARKSRRILAIAARVLDVTPNSRRHL